MMRIGHLAKSNMKRHGRTFLTLLALLFLSLLLAFLTTSNAVRYPILLVALLVCGTTLVKPRWGILGLFGFLPFIYFFKRIEYSVYADPASEYNNPMSLIPELITLSLLMSLLVHKLRRKRLTWPVDKFSLLVGAFFLISALQILNPRSTITIGLYGFRTFGFYILIYFIGLYWTERKFVRTLLKWGLAIATLAALYGIIQQLTQLPVWDRMWVTDILPENPISWMTSLVFSFGGMRKWATLHSPPAAANYFAFSIVLGFVCFQHLKRRGNKLVLALALAIIGTAMLFTSTRGSWVALAVALLTMTLVDWSRRISTSQFRTLLTTAILLAILIAVGWGSIRLSAPLLAQMGGAGKRIAALSDPLDAAQMHGRYITWQTILAGSDLLGQGIGKTGSVGTRFAAASSLRASDNLYFKVLYELGWIGLSVFLLLLLAALKLAWQTYFALEDPRMRWVILGILGLIVVVIVNGIVAPTLEYSIVAIPFWFWLGALRRLSFESLRGTTHDAKP